MYNLPVRLTDGTQPVDFQLGLTGLGQANKRSDVSCEERGRLEMYYICSPVSD